MAKIPFLKVMNGTTWLKWLLKSGGMQILIGQRCNTTQVNFLHIQKILVERTVLALQIHIYSTQSQSKGTKVSLDQGGQKLLRNAQSFKDEGNGSHHSCSKIGLQRSIYGCSCSRNLFEATTKAAWSEIVVKSSLIPYIKLYT